ncbi:diphosphomevalonate decarboxylase [Nocardia wallacei]|uniref:diphosphomevalonate decarboxylase n=1 Tax=Nocardia wallacei TaxID=480035 RepID=UPI002454ACE4|nr:diphosphomevalonate decarboxylase [Nocardia wallacei]
MTGEPVVAVANPNIALIKYWGKRDAALHLPTTTSLSLTLREFPTTTTVTVTSGLETDRVSLAGQTASDAFAGRVSRFLDIVRELSGDRRNAVVDTVNTVPTGAGLASSAAGFAALATAASAAYGLGLDRAALSRLARRGSGSAARSVIGGFAVWWRGEGLGAEGDLSSFAEPIDAQRVTPALVVALVDEGEKPVSSREAMRRTVATSPFYRPWVETSAHDLSRMMCALRAGDLPTVGEIAEANALGMHATMLGARPAIRYLAPASLRVLDRVLALRSAGIGAWATMDAGPNVKVLCDRRDSAAVADAVADSARVVVATPGGGAELGGDRSVGSMHGPEGQR